MLSNPLSAGSQVPLTLPRSDARQNLVDAMTCATSFFNPPHVHLQVSMLAGVSSLFFQDSQGCMGAPCTMKAWHCDLTLT